jgi:hypothetical protein
MLECVAEFLKLAMNSWPFELLRAFVLPRRRDTLN